MLDQLPMQDQDPSTASLYVSQVWISNRAPFADLSILFKPAEVAILSALNGQGKTTLLSYIADALYEMAKPHFTDVAPTEGSYYRVVAGVDRLLSDRPSLFYLRFASGDQVFDYVDLRQPCSKEQYLELVANIPAPVDFDQQIAAPLQREGTAKIMSKNWTKEVAERVFEQGVFTFFPAYRFEPPDYLNESFQTKLKFRQSNAYKGRLNKPLESTTSFPQIANWLMDVVLDHVINHTNLKTTRLFAAINDIVTLALSAKNFGPVRLGIGPRNFGSTRVQIVTRNQPPALVYPTIFRLSSGEQALLTLFAEILRQADQTRPDISLSDISGVVLVDEIDKHLHIKLQRETLPLLLQLFPKVQFIASSHSPFLGMGLVDTFAERGRVIDVASGLSLTPTKDPLYDEVYRLMLGEEARFRELYTNLQKQIDPAKKLQIISEGANNAYIKKAIEILRPDAAFNLHIVSGAEGKTGAQQLKNAFEVMSSAHHASHFLFVWDCDAEKEFHAVTEKNNCWKYKFTLNETNTKTDRGIENNFSDEHFSLDVYDNEVVDIGYGGKNEKTVFNKKAFLNKIAELTDAKHFSNFLDLMKKIDEILIK